MLSVRGGSVSGEIFNSEMLKLARDVRGFTQAQLAERSGVTQAFISKLEHGLNNQPGNDALEGISQALSFPVRFFFQREKTHGFPHFHYRKRARLGARTLAQIEASINTRRLHISKLLRSYDDDISKPIPQLDLDEIGLTPEKLAARMRAYWLLPRGPIRNVVEVIEDAGGIVILCHFGTNLLDGLSVRVDGLPPLFFMNRDVTGDRFRFSLAHELGHMIMHAIPGDDQQMENEAHRFAATFLMPPTEIRPYLAGAKIGNLGRVKAYWKVSIKTLIKRMDDLKLITPYQYKSLNIKYNKMFRCGEPVSISLEEPAKISRIVNYHRDVLDYSIEDLSKILSLFPEEFQSMYLGKQAGLRLVVSN